MLEEGTRPEHIIPVGTVDGAWNMIKRVGRFRSEGWLALWKGPRLDRLFICISDKLFVRPRNFDSDRNAVNSYAASHQPISAVSFLPFDAALSPASFLSTHCIPCPYRIHPFSSRSHSNSPCRAIIQPSLSDLHRSSRCSAQNSPRRRWPESHLLPPQSPHSHFPRQCIAIHHFICTPWSHRFLFWCLTYN